MSKGARDPFDCPHDTGERFGGYVLCDRNGGRVWTNCQSGVAGDAPMCAYEEPDNSDEACRRRLAWLRSQEAGVQLSLF